MIGKLKGLINSYGEDYVILDVGGVGYQVHCSSRTLQALPSPGEAAVLSIETYVREDQIKLFGFRTDTRARMVSPAADRAGRRRQGRTRGALDAAAGRTRQRHRAARQGRGVAHARRRPESRRTHRHELKDKAPAFANVDPAVVHLAGAIDDHRAPRPVTDAISALVNLGYGQPQAAAAIAAASRSAGEKAETAQLIRLGLKELSK